MHEKCLNCMYIKVTIHQQSRTGIFKINIWWTEFNNEVSVVSSEKMSPIIDRIFSQHHQARYHTTAAVTTSNWYRSSTIKIDPDKRKTHDTYHIGIENWNRKPPKFSDGKIEREGEKLVRRKLTKNSLFWQTSIFGRRRRKKCFLARVFLRRGVCGLPVI